MTVDIAMLSEAQRVIMSQSMGVATHRFYPARAHRACRALAGMGLLTESTDGVGNPMFQFTPAGLEARALLLKDNSDAG